MSFRYRLFYPGGRRTDWYVSKIFESREMARAKAGEWVAICLVNDVTGVQIELVD